MVKNNYIYRKIDIKALLFIGADMFKNEKHSNMLP